MNSIMRTLIAGVLILWMVTPPVSAEMAQPVVDESLIQEIQSLKQLRSENPQAYREAVRRKKEAFLSAYQSLPAEEQNHFGYFMENQAASRQHRLEKLRHESPEAFRDFAKNRLSRFRQLKERNPAGFRQAIQNHPQLRERMKNFERNQFRNRRAQKESHQANSKRSNAQINRERKGGLAPMNPNIPANNKESVQRPMNSPGMLVHHKKVNMPDDVIYPKERIPGERIADKSFKPPVGNIPPTHERARGVPTGGAWGQQRPPRSEASAPARKFKDQKHFQQFSQGGTSLRQPETSTPRRWEGSRGPQQERGGSVLQLRPKRKDRAS